MTSRQALTALFNEANRFSCEEPKYTTHDLWEMAKQIEKDLKFLEILKSNITDYSVEYGNDKRVYNTATINIQVRNLRGFTGKEIYYIPGYKSISDADFNFFTDILFKVRLEELYGEKLVWPVEEQLN